MPRKVSEAPLSLAAGYLGGAPLSWSVDSLLSLPRRDSAPRLCGRDLLPQRGAGDEFQEWQDTTHT